MSALPGSETRSSSPWLKEVDDAIIPLMAVVNRVPAGLQLPLFERLLDHVLRDARREVEQVVPLAPRGAMIALPSSAVGTPPSPSESSALRFEHFVRDYGVTPEMLANIVDFETGHVLTRSLGNAKADKQRRLAALLAVINAKRSGTFYVGKDDLVRVCNEHAALDTSNFTATMRRTVYKGAAVFSADENGYRVSRPGEEFVADVIRQTQPQSTPPQTAVPSIPLTRTG